MELTKHFERVCNTCVKSDEVANQRRVSNKDFSVTETMKEYGKGVLSKNVNDLLDDMEVPSSVVETAGELATKVMEANEVEAEELDAELEGSDAESMDADDEENEAAQQQHQVKEGQAEEESEVVEAAEK